MGVIYVGADVHKRITTFFAMDELGSLVSQALVPTHSENLVHFVSSLPGTVHLTFEEGTQAQWLHWLLKEHVSRLVVCDPSKNRLDSRGNINDMKVAEELAHLLRCNRLVSVFHGSDGIQKLKNIERTYQSLVKDRTRVKNQLQAIFRGRGIPIKGSTLYTPEGLEKARPLLAKQEGLRFRMEMLHQQLQALETLTEEARKAVLKEVRRHMIYRVLWVPSSLALKFRKKWHWVCRPEGR